MTHHGSRCPLHPTLHPFFTSSSVCLFPSPYFTPLLCFLSLLYPPSPDLKGASPLLCHTPTHTHTVHHSWSSMSECTAIRPRVNQRHGRGRGWCLCTPGQNCLFMETSDGSNLIPSLVGGRFYQGLLAVQ